MIRKHYSVALTATCVILGVIIGVQVNTVKQQRITTENQRLSEATAALNQLQAEHDALLKQNKLWKRPSRSIRMAPLARKWNSYFPLPD